MKTKFIALLSGLFLTAGILSAQEADCRTDLSLFSQSAKVEDYKSAEPYYEKLVENCPNYNLAIYQYGERMYKSYLQDAEGADKMKYAKALIENYEMRLANFPKKTKKGEVYANIAQVKYDNGIATKEEQYKAFDDAWKTDPESFNSPKALYTYFSLLVDLQDAGKRDLQDVFAKYDELIEKIETEEIKQAEASEPLIKKQEDGEELTKKEAKILSNADIYLTNFSKIKDGINGKLGQRADCENLIPLYNKEFDANKDNVDWLKRAARRLSEKECTGEPLFVKLVEALHQKEPSAKSALYLGQVAAKNGDNAKSLKYYNQSADLETNPLDKARVYYKIANNYKNKGSYSNARTFYRKALKNQPSLGNAYLQIASMYAKSANNCGSDTFSKQAVYWLAADYADRAGRVNPSLKTTASKASAAYRGRAPSNKDIFSQGIEEGSTIRIGCWIGESVRVPSI